MISRVRSLMCWVLLVLAGGMVYVTQYWSPSSYGTFLKEIGQPGEGLVFGQPRPVRSDEWGVVTPLTRAAINNGFERYNKTSLYGEDLRINYGLPLADWGLLFKPTLWPYFWVEPARAYSFHWYAVLVLFIAGHAWLFGRLGLSPPAAVLLSLGLYFTPFVQFWWNEKGPVMAFFPCVIGVLLTSWRPWVRLLACYWLGASWFITNFYPPLFVSLAFVGVLLLLALEPQWFRPGRLAGLVLAAGAAGATALLYLNDYLLATMKTEYPGRRSASGGSVSWGEWWAQLLPHVTFDTHYASALQRPDLIGVAGAAFVLVAICCLDYRQLYALLREDARMRRLCAVLGVGLLLMYAWMLLPLPSWMGAVLLWNHVLPERMHYAAGLMLMMWMAFAVERAGLRISVRRLALYGVLLTLGWLSMNLWINTQAFIINWRMRGADLIMLPVLAICLTLGRWCRWPASSSVMGASTATAAAVMFGFNPIQSAKPIFAPPPEALRRLLDADRTDGGAGPVAASGYFGATINGLGYPSVSHVTPVPALAYWRQRYPALPEQEFLSIFNRYSHIRLRADVSAPNVEFADAVAVPLRDYWPRRVRWPVGEATPPAYVRWLDQGHSYAMTASVPMSGTLEHMAVMVGTGQGSSDGRLRLRLCQEAQCANGEAELRHARDNTLLKIQLRSPLQVQDNAELKAELMLSGGTHALGLWMSTNAEPGMLSPRWELGYR